ncbi:Ku protein [Streptomyces sp. NPDC101227]|uniref:non-homologous end joining protein Ku n=1 Tax=Streptomyces sp. NPDC101227 TaxID=3366136 RepID=UPI00381596CA
MTVVWSGTVSISMISLPIRLSPATREARGGQVHELHASDGGRVRHRRFCSVEGREIPYEEVARGVDTPTGTVVLTDEDLARLPLPARRVLSVLAFVPVEAVDPVAFRSAYHVEPGPGGDRVYALLAAAMARTRRMAVGKLALRDRERPAILRSSGGRLVLHTCYWPHELRAPEHQAPSSAFADRELAIAELLVDALSSDTPPELDDEYSTALDELVEAKAAGGELAPPAEPPLAAPVDLMAMLEAAVREAREDRGDRGGSQGPAGV